MQNLLSLARRRWLTEHKSHLASVVIAAAVVTAWLLYWGYMNHMGAYMSHRVADSDFPADFALTTEPGLSYLVPAAYVEVLQSFHQLEMATPLGMQPVAASGLARPNAPLPVPAAGEVWLPEELRGVNQIDVGSPFEVAILQDLLYVRAEGKVAGFYHAYDFYPAIVMDSLWLRDQGILLKGSEVTLYRRGPNFDSWRYRMPAGVTLQTASSASELALQVVQVAFSSGGQGVGLLFLFLVLGVGTFSLLTFMDSRRELALLKSMGLRPKELSGLFVLEGALTAVLGICTALAIVSLIERFSYLPINIDFALAVRATLFSLFAFGAATAVPYLLAQRAEVNELLFGRPVPLFRRRITAVNRRYPALDSLLDAGYQLIKLPVVDFGFPGICFRRVGQQVLAGETVAWESYGFGIGEREYLAPCDGEVVEADLERGLVVIKPTKDKQ